MLHPSVTPSSQGEAFPFRHPASVFC